MEEKEPGKLRNYLVDTAAMISFSIPTGMANELLIAGMTFEQSLESRLIGTAVNIATARPYGAYRDFVFKKCRVTQKTGFLKKYVVDTLAFGTFQAPLYAGILYCVGADMDQIASAVGTITVMSGLLGRPYGMFLDFFRTLFGTKPAYKTLDDAIENDRK